MELAVLVLDGRFFFFLHRRGSSRVGRGLSLVTLERWGEKRHPLVSISTETNAFQSSSSGLDRIAYQSLTLSLKRGKVISAG